MTELTSDLCINGKRYSAPILRDNGNPRPRVYEVDGQLYINHAYLSGLPPAKQAVIIANQPNPDAD